ncbi:hypothetical protein FOZ62_000828 [Perkinsus olseni]|uniref:Uncharacterized protein n=1 Tax=Perkinsus olseni TaxID=32597 RepID=A0A7J6R908_PEROL|nr:hypothetical protein FOZ62_000828 [Perkinsus olseni]
MHTEHSTWTNDDDPEEHFLSWLGTYEVPKKKDNRRGVLRKGSLILRLALFAVSLVAAITIGPSPVWIPHTLKLYQAGTLSLTVESLEIIGPFDCVLFELSDDFCMHGQSVLNVTYDGWESVTVAYAYGQVVSSGEELDWATLSFPKFRVPPGMRGMMTVHSFLLVSHRKAYIRQIRGHANASHKFGPFFGRLPPVLDEYRVLGTETVLGPGNLSWSPMP